MSSALWWVANGRAAAPPMIVCIIGVSTSRKPRASRKRGCRARSGCACGTPRAPRGWRRGRRSAGGSASRRRSGRATSRAAGGSPWSGAPGSRRRWSARRVLRDRSGCRPAPMKSPRSAASRARRRRRRSTSLLHPDLNLAGAVQQLDEGGALPKPRYATMRPATLKCSSDKRGRRGALLGRRPAAGVASGEPGDDLAGRVGRAEAVGVRVAPRARSSAAFSRVPRSARARRPSRLHGLSTEPTAPGRL